MAKNKRWKIRLVVRGCNHKEDIYFNEVFSTIVHHTFIRVLLTFVVLFDLELEQLDMKTTFLNGELEEEIYMRKPTGFVVPGKENHVCLLKEALIWPETSATTMVQKV